MFFSYIYLLINKTPKEKKEVFQKEPYGTAPCQTHISFFLSGLVKYPKMMLLSTTFYFLYLSVCVSKVPIIGKIGFTKANKKCLKF